MTASRRLQRYWRDAGAAEVSRVLHEARASVAAFAEATSAHGSLIQSWVAGSPVIQFEHYPPNDLVDVRRGSQFYYHSHRDGD